MKLVINEPYIKKRRQFGVITTVSSMAVLGVGFYISWQYEEYLHYAFFALILGFVLSQIGIYFGNRFGRTPRPDEVLSQSLKGLDNKFTLYHYTSPVSHLLLGPAGVWVLLAFNQGGVISYNEKRNRWQQKGGNWYFKIFGQEGLGRPDQDAKFQVEDLEKFLAKQTDLKDIPPVNAALVFVNEKASVESVDNAPIPTLAVAKLADYFRQVSRQEDIISKTTLRQLQDLFSIKE